MTHASPRLCGAVAAMTLLAACGEVPPLPPLPEGAIAFGVFGDGPYRSWENRRFARLLQDVDSADVAWLLHIGDILWYPCTAEAYRDRLASLNRLDRPVVYTPGDNEWADCSDDIAGGWLPLDRLQLLRSVFFTDPSRSIGGRPMPLTSQAADSVHAEFVENVRWRRGAFVFATVHMVGSPNGGEPFPGRTAADDREVERRTAAALDWMERTFAIAHEQELGVVVLALHGDPGFGAVATAWPGYETFVARLAALVAAFPGEVLLIHGDSHEQRLDRPLADPADGRTLANFTRLETFGSPDIGWIRVVIDTVAGRVLDVQPRLMPGGLPFH